MTAFRSERSISTSERARSAGLAVTTWTVNEPADVDRVLTAGVDGIVTDAVAAALARCRDG